MLTSITPLGERGRRRRWGSTTAWYVAGSIVGGAGIGVLAGLIGLALAQWDAGGTVVLIVAALGCLVAAISDGRGLRPYSWRRQVDETWLGRYRGWVVGGGFGIQLGFGVVTIVSSASVYATLLLAALTRSFWGGLLVGTAFGLVRALPLLTVRRVTSNEALAGLHRQVNVSAPMARRATVGVLGVAGLALAAAAIAGVGS